RRHIAKANVTVANVTASDKVYDTTTNAALSNGNVTVQLGNASAANGSLANATTFSNYTANGTFANASAGSNKLVSLNVALADTTNYTLSGTTQQNMTANIVKANVTVANVTASDKVYDTTTNAAISNVGAATVLLGNASAANGTLASATGYSNYTVNGSYANAAAGSQTVSVNVALADTTNYALSTSSQNQTTATIAKANVTVANVTASDKVYDTTTNAAISNVGAATVLLGNASAANGTLASATGYSNYTVNGSYANAAAGSQMVNVNVALADTTNYALSTSSQNKTTANIAKANVTVANVTASDKVYDTTTNAALSNGNVTVQLGKASAANGSS
ncbi:YDG domain-containing protein, partial [Herbaspirillum sp. B65]|uniref:YDG domain-containing protein n=1 Tax=Herbaspirillum sp. B65 TaxID=137708 RepID=UPI0020900A38